MKHLAMIQSEFLKVARHGDKDRVRRYLTYLWKAEDDLKKAKSSERRKDAQNRIKLWKKRIDKLSNGSKKTTDSKPKEMNQFGFPDSKFGKRAIKFTNAKIKEIKKEIASDKKNDIDLSIDGQYLDDACGDILMKLDESVPGDYGNKNFEQYQDEYNTIENAISSMLEAAFPE